MRPFTVTLLSTCAVCALAQGHHTASAQPAPAPGQPAPTKPTDPPLPTSADPANPSNPQLPPGPSGPAVPAPADQANAPLPSDTGPNPATPTAPMTSDPASPVGQPPPPIPDSSTTTTTTTTTTVTPAMTDADDIALESPDIYSYAWSDNRLQSGIGISAILGGGVTGFTDKTMLDVSYLGQAMNINGLPAGRNGTLIGTTVEGAARFNVLPHYAWNPYVFAGVGWQRYDVTQTNVSLSDSGMNDKDNLLEFPMGVGFSYRSGGFVGDLRGTFRAMTDQDLVLKAPLNPDVALSSDNFAPMHTWEASAAVGYEF